MKVLDLCCTRGHVFEGWFGSEDDFLSQQQRQLVQCPVCGDAQIVRRPSAPRLNLSTTRGDRPATQAQAAPAAAAASGRSIAAAGAGPQPALPSAPATPSPEIVQAVQAALTQVVREVLSQTEDVGERFAEEARRIHYGEAQSRGIRGQASAEERAELREEGIEVFSLPLPEGLNGPVH